MEKSQLKFPKGEKLKDFALMRELLENENNHFIRSAKALLG
jgi:hypothetical protein